MFVIDTPQLRAPAWAQVQSVGLSRWRVTDRAGRIVGHVRAIERAGGWRFAAERFAPASRAFRHLGEFWSADEALDCLRYSR